MALEVNDETARKARAAFHGLDEMTYLNVGTYGLTPQPVLERYQETIERAARYGFLLHYDEALPAVRRAREAVAELLDVPAAWVAFDQNATDGVNQVFSSLDWQPDDEVVISDQEHPALLWPWQYGQRRGLFRGATFAIDADPAVTLRHVEAALTPQTRLLACSHVSSQTGIRLPAAAICALARRHAERQPRSRPLLTLIDGAQAVGQWPLSVREIGCDFYVTNGHKWLGAPKGSGLLIVRDAAFPLLTPPYTGGGLEPLPDPFSAFLERRDAERLFESGTRNLAVIGALTDAIAWLNELGWTWLEGRERALSASLKDLLRAVPGLRLLTPEEWEHGSALTSFTIEGASALALHEALWRQRIVTRWVPELNALRLSTAYFNSEAELERLVTALRRLLATAPQA